MKKVLIAVGLALVLLGPAVAQQPQQQSPSAVAIQINTVIGQWAQALEALQKDNAELQKRITDLTAKCGDACKNLGENKAIPTKK